MVGQRATKTRPAPSPQISAPIQSAPTEPVRFRHRRIDSIDTSRPPVTATATAGVLVSKAKPSASDELIR